MGQKINKDKWIEEILDSAEKIKHIEASPFIYPKILHRLKNQSNAGRIIPVRRAAIGFITIILLAVINVFVITKSGNQTVIEKNNVPKTESSSNFIPSQYNPYLEILNGN